MGQCPVSPPEIHVRPVITSNIRNAFDMPKMIVLRVYTILQTHTYNSEITFTSVNCVD